MKEERLQTIRKTEVHDMVSTCTFQNDVIEIHLTLIRTGAVINLCHQFVVVINSDDDDDNLCQEVRRRRRKKIPDV